MLETRVAWFTVAGLAVYVPLETWASLPALWSPFCLVDLIAMLLLGAGAARSLRARPRSAPGVLCAGYGWMGANCWRAFFGRLLDVLAGGTLEFGVSELWVVGVGTVLAVALLGITLRLVIQAEGQAQRPSAAP